MAGNSTLCAVFWKLPFVDYFTGFFRAVISGYCSRKKTKIAMTTIGPFIVLIICLVLLLGGLPWLCTDRTGIALSGAITRIGVPAALLTATFFVQ